MGAVGGGNSNTKAQREEEGTERREDKLFGRERAAGGAVEGRRNLTQLL
jgi:hypothetical protein